MRKHKRQRKETSESSLINWSCMSRQSALEFLTEQIQKGCSKGKTDVTLFMQHEIEDINSCCCFETNCKHISGARALTRMKTLFLAANLFYYAPDLSSHPWVANYKI